MKSVVEFDTLTPDVRLMMGRLQNPREAYDAMGLAIVSIAKRAHTDASLRPHVWPALRSGGQSTLQRETQMRRAWRHEATGTGAVVSNSTKYAAHHHWGTKAKELKAGPGKAFRFVVGGVVLYRKKVKHPGLPMRRVLPVVPGGEGLTRHAESVLAGIVQRKVLAGK